MVREVCTYIHDILITWQAILTWYGTLLMNAQRGGMGTLDDWPGSPYTDKKGNKILLIYKEIQRDQVQSHIWVTASLYVAKYLRISSYIRKPFLMYDFAPDPLWISLYIRKILFSFLSVYLIGEMTDCWVLVIDPLRIPAAGDDSSCMSSSCQKPARHAFFSFHHNEYHASLPAWQF